MHKNALMYSSLSKLYVMEMRLFKQNNTHTTSCSIPIPIILPIIAPTAILGMNKPDGTYNIYQ